MSFADWLADFRVEHPEIEAAEVYVADINGIARGKLVPIGILDNLADGAMKMPVSTVGLDIFSEDVAEAGIAIEQGDPDGVLVPVAERAREMGYHPVMALELEFYLIDPVEPMPPVNAAVGNPVAGGRLDRAQLYDMGVVRAFEPVISGITHAAQALGAPAEIAISEFGAGQFEMNLRHVADPLAAADHMIALKRAIRGVSRAQGFDASFMSKPFGAMSGSGMHIHLSLSDSEGDNLFASDTAEANSLLLNAVAGMREAMAECMLIFAPHQNSYRRFVPGAHAPLAADWGYDNRGAALRVLETSGPGARVEHRVSGSDANPYLLAAAVLAGALDGIARGAEPGAPVEGEPGPDGGTPLPLSWAMAEQAFTGSEFVAEWMGAEFRHVFAAAKRQERATLLARVSDVEYAAYLRVV